ncbi:hypothetical protein GCM10017788_76070 [Amycolatopsis acidiphila]|nr:hypothetical protein GCM10017788_76070 [Amycolatopsis acidiphila]
MARDGAGEHVEKGALTGGEAGPEQRSGPGVEHSGQGRFQRRQQGPSLTFRNKSGLLSHGEAPGATAQPT